MTNITDRQRELHAKRIAEALREIANLRDPNVTVHTAEFRGWKERVEHSLGLLFGEDHSYTSYTERFGHLSFWIARMAPAGSGPAWDARDQERKVRDLDVAQGLLRDAVEELDLLPTQHAQPGTAQAPSAPAVVVNVTNVLSQTTTVDVKQLIAGLGDLDLLPEQRAQAEEHAEELDVEASGERRWPVLARPLEALRKLGKPVYDGVAVPILLEMLKKQAGL